MGLLEEAEAAAAAALAVEAAKKVDPNAGILTEAAAAYAGFEGAEKLQEHFDQKPEDPQS